MEDGDTKASSDSLGPRETVGSNEKSPNTRNFYTAIHLLRILQKLVKGKVTRIQVLMKFKAAVWKAKTVPDVMLVGSVEEGHESESTRSQSLFIEDHQKPRSSNGEEVEAKYADAYY